MSFRPRGCQTCTARKVLCDRAVPECQRCIQSNRTCLGYGLRLSWPGKNARRSLSATPRGLPFSADQNALQRAWINTFSYDVQVHYQEESLHRIEEMAIENVAFQSLRVFGQDASEIRNLVLRMAFAHASPSADAVIQAILALSALHGNRSPLCSRDPGQASLLKTKALRALATSVSQDLDSDDAARHVVCGMLLCAYEIQNVTDKSDYWLWFICGAKSLIKQQKLDAPDRSDDFNLLVGWVQYYEVMARFSLRHWKRAGTAEYRFADKLGYHDKMPPVCAKSPIIADLAEPPNVLLDLLREVVNLPAEDVYREADYKRLALDLECELNGSSMTSRLPSDTAESQIVEIFRLSILVYLYRCTATAKSRDIDHDDRVDTAFAILSQLDTLPYPFPLFVMGLEAQSDEQRRIFIHLINKTQATMSVSAMAFVESITRSVWVQDDLAAGRLQGSITYMDKIDSHISCQATLPVFI